MDAEDVEGDDEDDEDNVVNDEDLDKRGKKWKSRRFDLDPLPPFVAADILLAPPIDVLEILTP